MTKEELRKLYSVKRKKLSASECAFFNQKLVHHFFSSINLSQIKVIHTYLPISKNNEPGTWKIIEMIQREFPQIRISVPRVADDRVFENFYFEGLHQLQTSAWGIQEPKQGIKTPVEEIDMVLVPLLVIDRRGHRVGYGKGYYDRFLKTCNRDCKTIGLSFFKPVELITDTIDSDVTLNSCVEPSGIHYF